jgi:rubrerythrin
MVAQPQAQPYQELRLALAAEVDEAVRYLLYADQAQREGYPEIAALFAHAAQRDALEYARVHARALGEVGTTQENLVRAIRREYTNSTELYPSLARHAAANGDDNLATHLWRLATATEQHALAFRQAYEALEQQANASAQAPAVMAPGDDVAVPEQSAPARGPMPAPDFVPRPVLTRRPARRFVEEPFEFIDDLSEAQPAPAPSEGLIRDRPPLTGARAAGRGRAARRVPPMEL